MTPPPPDRAPRFLLYSHDGLGLGHIRRNLNLAAAIIDQRPGTSVLLATGAEDLTALTIPDGVDVVRIPGLRKLGNDDYAPRRLPLPSSDLLGLRTALLLAAVERFAPHVVVADRHPTGVGGELGPALRALRAGGGRVALGLRDVLDTPERVRAEWGGARAADAGRLVDLVLVYGLRGLMDPVADPLLPAWLRRRAVHCGYVVDPGVLIAADGGAGPDPGEETDARRVAGSPVAGPRPRVLAMAGGGEDGATALRAAIRAGAGAPWHTVVVTGPHLDPEVRRSLAAEAAVAGVELHRSVTDLGRQLAHVDAVVCMGGYNTITEVMAAGVPAVCIPRVVPRTEQLLRARALQQRGLVDVVEPGQLSAGRLRDAIAGALRTDRAALRARIGEQLAFDGASRAAAALIDLADAAPGSPAGPPHRRRPRSTDQTLPASPRTPSPDPAKPVPTTPVPTTPAPTTPAATQEVFA